METLLATVVYVSPAAISAGKLSIRLFYKIHFCRKQWAILLSLAGRSEVCGL